MVKTDKNDDVLNIPAIVNTENVGLIIKRNLYK